MVILLKTCGDGVRARDANIYKRIAPHLRFACATDTVPGCNTFTGHETSSSKGEFHMNVKTQTLAAFSAASILMITLVAPVAAKTVAGGYRGAFGARGAY